MAWLNGKTKKAVVYGQPRQLTLDRAIAPSSVFAENGLFVYFTDAKTGYDVQLWLYADELRQIVDAYKKPG